MGATVEGGLGFGTEVDCEGPMGASAFAEEAAEGGSWEMLDEAGNRGGAGGISGEAGMDAGGVDEESTVREPG